MTKKIRVILSAAVVLLLAIGTVWSASFELKSFQDKFRLISERTTKNDPVSPAGFVANTIESKARIGWNPRNFIRPPIHLPLDGISTLDLIVENVGTDTLFVHSISSGASWLSIDPTSTTMLPGCCPLIVELTVNAGNEETFLVDSVRIQSNDQAGNDDIYVPMHVIVSEHYQEVEFSAVGNPTYYLGVSNTGNLANTNDTLGFYLHQDPNRPNFLYDGSVILGFTSPDGDSLVGRYIFYDDYILPETELSVDTIPGLKTIVVEAEFCPVTPQAPLPWHHQWWYWTIKMKDFIFYSQAPDNKNEQYILLRHLQLYYNPPPDWWEPKDSLPYIPEIYLGMALDIDCPSDSGAWNYAGSYDETRRMTYIQGYGGGANEYYRMAIAQKDQCYDTLHNCEGLMTFCWRDNDNPIYEKDPVYAMHILRNDSAVYPAGGYVDEELYRYMSTPGHILQGDGSPADYNIVTTGKVIPAQSFPPSDTYSVAYVLVVSDEENIDKLNDCVDMVKCGNVNRDHTVSVADIVYFINYLFRGGPEIWKYIGDANADGVSNITDCCYLINYLLIGGPPPKCSSL